MKNLAFLLMTSVAISANVCADIEKIATPSNSGIQLYWWPKVTPPTGWHQDKEQSVANGINALAPDGSTFADADAVIYAKALFKPREPDVKSLEMLIAKDKKDFLANDSTISITEGAPLVTADGRKWKTLLFVPKSKGNWERVAYGEEGEFYLVFAISSRTKAGFESASTSYEQLVNRYREKP